MSVVKGLILTLVLVIALSNLTMVGTVQAQTTTKPAKPDFTVELQNGTVVLTIENQPFDVNNSYNNSFFYDVRISTLNGYWSSVYTAKGDYPTQSNASQTIFYYEVGKSEYFPSVATVEGIAVPANGQVFFQVNAMIGHWGDGTYSHDTTEYGFIGEVSGWSGSQVIALTEHSNPSYYTSPGGKIGSSYKIMLFIPNDKTAYTNELPLAFNLRWYYVAMPMGGELEGDYAYSIDDGPFVSIVPNQTVSDRYAGGTNFVYNPSFSYLLDISNLTNGQHEIVINACFYYGYLGLQLNATSRPFPFSVEGQTQKPTITTSPPDISSAPNQTEITTSTPTPTVTLEATITAEPFPTVPVFVVSVGPTAIAIIVLIHYKKRPKLKKTTQD
jgi:hypothetical protein